MTVRSFLWLVLGLVGVPFLIEGSGGCGFQSQASAPIDDNAYTCGCRCDAAPVTKTVAIVANTDDAEQDGANVRLGGNDLHIGPDIVGLRFVNVGLPKDATIVSAAVQFTRQRDRHRPGHRGDRRGGRLQRGDVQQHRQRHQQPAPDRGLGAVVTGPVEQQREGTGRADARPVRRCSRSS